MESSAGTDVVTWCSSSWCLSFTLAHELSDPGSFPPVNYQPHGQEHIDSEYTRIYVYSDKVRSYEDSHSVDRKEHVVRANNVAPTTQNYEAHHHDVFVFDDRSINGIAPCPAAYVLVGERSAVVQRETLSSGRSLGYEEEGLGMDYRALNAGWGIAI